MSRSEYEANVSLQRYVVQRRRRPMSRGTLFRVFTVEQWRADGMPAFVTTSYNAVLAFKRGQPLPTEPAMPGARASIVRPLHRYL